LPEEAIEEILEAARGPSVEDELEEVYYPSENTRRRYHQALRDYNDYRIFNMAPNAGGLDDQPLEWIEALRCVTTAKEWAEALKRLRSEYEQANSGDEKSRDQERVDEIGAELQELQKAHDERIEGMRASVER
jgi:hypothetical protein